MTSFVEALQRDLHTYRQRFPLEEDPLALMQQQLQRDHCCDRSMFSPGHFTASALVADVAGTSMLLILHSKTRLWLQPGGHIDADDITPQAAALRELVEETMIEPVALAQRDEAVLLDIDIHAIEARGDAPSHLHFDLRYALIAHEARVCASSDALDVRWVPFGELEDIHTDNSVRRAARKLQAFATEAFAVHGTKRVEVAPSGR